MTDPKTPRRKSFWGWGYEDKFPAREVREGLAAQLGGVLGFGELALMEPPRLEDIELRAPRFTPPPQLAAFCSDAPYDRASRTYGRSFPDILRGFEGRFEHPPDWVATPETEEQIEALLSWASDQKVVVVPFGGGTSVVGGIDAIVPSGYKGAITLDLCRFQKVVEIDHESLHARIQAGATGPQLEQQLAAHGLTLRHFPQSFEFSTLGGWIATRAGGHFATLYTHIDDLVAGVRMLTPTGRWEGAALPGSGAGPEASRMVLGSEGTLGVITEGTMRVRRRPRWRAKAEVYFKEFADAIEAVRAIAQAHLYPANCRLLDAREAMLHGVSYDDVQVLLLGFESAHHPVEHPMQAALAIAQEQGGRLPKAPRYTDAEAEQRPGDVKGDANAAEQWRSAFIETPYLFNAVMSLGVVVDTFETACTWQRFEALHTDVIQSVRAALKEACGKGFVSCRLTHVYPDGPAPYYTFLGPAKPGAAQQQWQTIKAAASEALLRHDATITHHHAVGRVHKPYYLRQVPDPMRRILQASKRELDPQAVLNPGVLFDL